MGTSYKHPNEIYDNDWESLNEGDTIRVHCSHWKCEDKNDAFTITRTFDGCVYNCYRCGTSGIVRRNSNPTMAIRRLQSLRTGRKLSMTNGVPYKVELPGDFIPLVTHHHSIPPNAYAWFYKYELNDDDLDTYYIGWSPKFQRVVIPIYENGKLIAWQGRDVFYEKNMEIYKTGHMKKKPLKYYTEYNKYNNNNNKLYFKILNKNKDKNKLLIIEDIISAIKCYNKFNMDTVALLNSTLHNKLKDDLNFRAYKEIIVWTDPDAYVRTVQALMRWRASGIECIAVRSEVDPKDISYKAMNLF